jgi:hypothetical protein
MHLDQDAEGAVAYGGRRTGDSLFVEASGVRVLRSEVAHDVRVATRDQPLTCDSTFRLDLGNRANARCFQGFYDPFLDLWVGVHCRVERGIVIRKIRRWP